MESYLYYAGSAVHCWCAGIKELMEAGENDTIIVLMSGDALSPDKATETWQVYSAGGDELQESPQLKVRICTEHEKQVKAKEEAEAAVAAGKEAKNLMIWQSTPLSEYIIHDA